MAVETTVPEDITHCLAFNLGHPVWEVCVCHYRDSLGGLLQTECVVAVEHLTPGPAPPQLVPDLALVLVAVAVLAKRRCITCPM